MNINTCEQVSIKASEGWYTINRIENLLQDYLFTLAVPIHFKDYLCNIEEKSRLKVNNRARTYVGNLQVSYSWATIG